MGWELDKVGPVINPAGLRLQAVSTLAPGRKPEGNQRVVRVRRLSNDVIELVVVFSRDINHAGGLASGDYYDCQK